MLSFKESSTKVWARLFTTCVGVSVLAMCATKAMSSACLKSAIPSLCHKMLLVYTEKRIGDKTHPWGSPAFKKILNRSRAFEPCLTSSEINHIGDIVVA